MFKFSGVSLANLFSFQPVLGRTIGLFLLTVGGSVVSAQTQLPGAVEGQRYLVVYRNQQVPGNAAATMLAAGGRLAERHELLGVAVVEGATKEVRARLAADANVEYVVPDVLLNAHQLVVAKPDALTAATAPTTGPDALYHSAAGWAVRQVGGFGADGTAGSGAGSAAGPWNQTKGAGVRIAILDSGVDASHPDIAPNLELNLSEIVPSALPSACDDGSAADQEGHGTWAASLAAGALGAQTGLVAGVAPQATLLNIKVLERMPGTKTAADPTGCIGGQAAGLLSWVLKGIEDAVTQRADVISMSLGTLVDVSTGDGAGLQAVFNRATLAASNAGVILIAAAGNDGYNLANQRYVELPAQARGVVAIVASTNPLCAENLKAGAVCVAGPVSRPYYSNYGAPLNALAAPGGSYPVGGAVAPGAAVITANSGWVTGACSSGKVGTVSGVPAVHGQSFGCFNLGHAAYVQAMGTSASAPLVAGAAALLRAAHPAWSAATVIAALRSSAVTNGTLTTPQVTVAKLLTPGK